MRWQRAADDLLARACADRPAMCSANVSLLLVSLAQAAWGSTSQNLADSYDYFEKMRQQGVRMHSWP